MEEQLISLETAKLAKEIGLKIVTPNYYNIDGIVMGHPYSDCRATNYNSYKDTATSAPTQSLLQKWLWETHKIWVEVCMWDGYFTYMIKQVEYSPEDKRDINFDRTGANNSFHKQYQNPYDLFEIGLREALKLVKGG